LQRVSITDQIREACAAVARRARCVRVNDAAIERYALSLPLEKAIAPAIDWTTHYRGDEAGTAAFFLVLDSINFCSGYFTHLRKRPGMSGYLTVASSLKDEFERGVLPAERLAVMTAEQCGAIFGQDAQNSAAMELMALFAVALNDLGRLLLAKYRGNAGELIQTAGGSAQRLIDLLAEMPFFCDVSSYENSAVPLYKRAQLLGADLSLALQGMGLGTFNDLDRLTIFADNLVPHVLRIDGVLDYADELANRIDREELIVAGSMEEVEIRACALHAVELMKAALSSAGRSVTAMGLDYILWNRGQEKYYKSIKPRHRARSVYY
jgi:hypothetical protein